MSRDHMTLKDVIAGATYEAILVFFRNASDEELKNYWSKGGKREGKFPRGGSSEKVRADAGNHRGVVMMSKYRPFDDRYVWYTGDAYIIACPRRNMIETMFGAFTSRYSFKNTYAPNVFDPFDRWSEPLDLKEHDKYMKTIIPEQFWGKMGLVQRGFEEGLIGYYLQHRVVKPIIDNIIDVCPVVNGMDFPNALEFIIRNRDDFIFYNETREIRYLPRGGSRYAFEEERTVQKERQS